MSDLCTRCGHTVDEHVIIDRPPIDTATLDRMTPARFPGVNWVGLYCPHLDMVAGVDYDDDATETP